MAGLSEALGLFSKVLDILKTVLGWWKKNKEGESTADKQLPRRTEEPTPPTPQSYQVVLGQRLKELRTDILDIGPRKMADLYGLEKVRELEALEEGRDEFSAEATNRLVEFFFVRRTYVEDGKGRIFEEFSLATSNDCGRFLDQGFKAHFMCDPSFDRTGHAFLVFAKVEGSLCRMIKSHHLAGFRSSGGGKSNVRSLIVALQDRHRRGIEVDFIQAREAEWERLSRGCWYNSSGRFGYMGSHVFDASDIFEKWFVEVLADRAEMRSTLGSSHTEPTAAG